MFRKVIFLIILIYAGILLLGATYEEFPIGAWYPWFYGEQIDVDSVGSIHSLKGIGFNGVYWALKDTHLALIRDEGMKGIFYKSSLLPQMCVSAMDYIFQTYTADRDSHNHPPTAWENIFVAIDDTTSGASNDRAVRIDSAHTGLILDNLRLRNYYSDLWGARALQPSHRHTSFPVIKDTTDDPPTLNEYLNIETDCRENPWCSLDDLIDSEVFCCDTVIDTTVTPPDTTIYHSRVFPAMGYIFYPRIRVAGTDPSPGDSTILCLIGFAGYDQGSTAPGNDSLYQWYPIYWNAFENANVYYDEELKFKVGLSKTLLNIRVKTPDGGAPVTFWIDHIRATDAFFNYMKWKLSEGDTTSLLEKKDINSSKLVQKYNNQCKFRN